MHTLCDLCEPWGIKVVAETLAEAVLQPRTRTMTGMASTTGGSTLTSPRTSACLTARRAVTHTTGTSRREAGTRKHHEPGVLLQ